MFDALGIQEGSQGQVSVNWDTPRITITKNVFRRSLDKIVNLFSMLTHVLHFASLVETVRSEPNIMSGPITPSGSKELKCHPEQLPNG